MNTPANFNFSVENGFNTKSLTDLIDGLEEQGMQDLAEALWQTQSAQNPSAEPLKILVASLFAIGDSEAADSWLKRFAAPNYEILYRDATPFSELIARLLKIQEFTLAAKIIALEYHYKNDSIKDNFIETLIETFHVLGETPVAEYLEKISERADQDFSTVNSQRAQIRTVLSKLLSEGHYRIALQAMIDQSSTNGQKLKRYLPRIFQLLRQNPSLPISKLKERDLDPEVFPAEISISTHGEALNNSQPESAYNLRKLVNTERRMRKKLLEQNIPNDFIDLLISKDLLNPEFADLMLNHFTLDDAREIIETGLDHSLAIQFAQVFKRFYGTKHTNGEHVIFTLRSGLKNPHDLEKLTTIFVQEEVRNPVQELCRYLQETSHRILLDLLETYTPDEVYYFIKF